jgi:uncharacterized membrane protein
LLKAETAIHDARKECGGVGSSSRVLALPRRRSLPRRASWAAALAYGGAATYALLFVGAAVVSFEAFRFAQIDLGSMAQAVWSTAHGHFLESTAPNGRNLTRLAGHVDPFLALLVPAWWVWPSPLMLLVLQAFVVSSGALPVYWLARKHAGSERAAVALAFGYLLYPATQFNADTIAEGFHAVSLALPFILFAVWFLDEDRPVPFALFALLAASTKEEIPAAIAGLGIWYGVRRGRRKIGALIFLLGLAATLLNFLVVIPHYAPGGSDPFSARYASVGGSPGGMLHKAVTDPAAFVHTVATGHKIVYLALLFGPFLGLWALEPLLLLGAVPDLAINLLSAKGEQTSIAYHYTAGIAPFVVAASVIGIGRLRRRAGRASLAVLALMSCLAILSPIAVILVRGDLATAVSGNPARAAKLHAVALIPANVPVSASNQLAGRIPSRRFMFSFPVVRDANWIIVDKNDNTYTDRAAYHAAVQDVLVKRREWQVVYSTRGVVVLRRRHGP